MVSVLHFYYNYTTFTSIENSGEITATGKNSGGIIGYAYLNSVLESKKLVDHCCTWCGHVSNYCYEYGACIFTATDVTNIGSVSGESNVGELFGYFVADANSTLSSYTVTGSVSVNGEAKEGNYDIGSNKNLALSGREIFVPIETPAPEENPEENPEGSTEETE